MASFPIPSPKAVVGHRHGRWLVVIGLLVLGAVPAVAQQVCDELPEAEPVEDAYALPLQQGLDLVRACGLGHRDAEVLVFRAGLSRDPAVIPALKGVVDAYRTTNSQLTRAALASLLVLGEPASYFLNVASRAAQPVSYDDRLTAEDAARVLAATLDSTVQAELQQIGGGAGVELVAEIGEFDRLRRLLLELPIIPSRAGTIRGRLDDLVWVLESELLTLPYRQLPDSQLVAFPSDGDTEYRPETLWGRRALQSLAASDPDSVRIYLGFDYPALDTLRERHGEEAVTGAKAYLREVAFPFEAFPPPPLTPGADVRPVLECVAEEADGSLTAFFGFENRTGLPAAIPFGTDNRVTPAAYDRRQPEAFDMPNVVPGRPGRTPFYPGFAWRVAFQPGQQVVWKLGPRTATASASSARCPQG